MGGSRFVSTTVIRRCDRHQIRLPNPGPVEENRPYVLLGNLFHGVVVCLATTLPPERAV